MSHKNLIAGILPTARVISITLGALDQNETGVDDEASREGLRWCNALQSYLDSFPAETIAKGYAQTKAFCDNALNSIEIIIESDLPKADKIKQVSVLVNTLSDESLIWQAKKGKDADYLNKSKQKANEKLAALRQSFT